MKLENVFAIKNEPSENLLECLNYYSDFQLEILIEAMKLTNQINPSAPKKEIVNFIYKTILERLDYIFDYLCNYDFLVTLALQQKDEDSKAQMLMNLKEEFGKDADEEILNSKLEIMGRGMAFLFAKDNNNPVFVVPAEIRKKILELYDIKKPKANKPGYLYNFLTYCEVLSNLYGLCPPDLFMQIFTRDFPECKISPKYLNLYFERAALLSGNFRFEENMLKSYYAEEPCKKLILLHRKNYKPYIPTEEEIFEHVNLFDYDEENDAFQDMFKFLRKEISNNIDSQRITFEVIVLIKVKNPVQDIIKLLQNHYGILSTEKSLKKFLSIYQKLNNTSHLWATWGHTPKSLADLDREERKSYFDDDFLESARKQKENRPHIELSNNCVIPSDDEIEKFRNELDIYWQNNGERPAWHKNAEKVLSRIMKDVQQNINIFAELPENSMERFLDQWLASIYHENAKSSNKFGNQKWHYYVFRIAEKLRDGLFTCLLPDGSPIVVASSGFNIHYEEGVYCTLAVLVDMGGWYLTYGPMLGWKGLTGRDIEVLAKSIASQTFDLKGLNGVIHFNPVPFWKASSISNVPLVIHNDAPVTQCYAETRFLNDVVPDFDDLFADSEDSSALLKEWKHEVSEKNPGKLERWVCNKEDYLGSCCLYHDKKSGTVLLFSCNEDMFDKAIAMLEQNFDKRQYKTIKYSIELTTLIKNEKFQKLLKKFENGF